MGRISFISLRKWISPKKPRTGLEDQPFHRDQELFQFLIRQITVPKNAEQLIQLAGKAHLKTPDEVFHTYLLFEKYICTFEPEQRFTRETLRESIGTHFPELRNQDPFSILFLGDIEKKNTVAIEFLSSFLDRLREQFGGAQDGFFSTPAKQTGPASRSDL